MQPSKKSTGTVVSDLGSRDDRPSGWSRREFVGGLAALSAGQTLFGAALAGEAGNPRRSIDVHHHFLSQPYLEFLGKNGQPLIGKWSVQADLDDMDAAGTATAMLSITNPGFFGEGNIEDTRTAVRGANEAAARLRADHPGRFGSFAALPLTDTEGSLREIEYALDTLKAEGIGLFTSYGDKWLGDPSFAPVYEELNRRKAIVYVHPIDAACCTSISQMMGVPEQGVMIGFGTDTTRSIASVLFTGTKARYPAITWIWSHAGGTMPFLIQRFLVGSSAEIIPGVVTQGQGVLAPKGDPGGVLNDIRTMYYDTAQAANPVAMGALNTCVGVSRILFGTDYWYYSSVGTARMLDACRVFNAKQLRAIYRENAGRIMPRYQSA